MIEVGGTIDEFNGRLELVGVELREHIVDFGEVTPEEVTIADLAARADPLDSDGPAALVFGDVAGYDLRDHTAAESLRSLETSEDRPAASAAAGGARGAATRHQRAGAGPREE